MNKKVKFWQDQNTIQLLAESLKKNQVSVGTSDTVLGFLSNLSQSGFERLNEIKKRSQKPYIILINSIEKLPLFTDQIIDEQFKKLISKCWPGPVTIIFKSKQNVSDYLKTFNNTIAIRISNHEGLLQLLTNFDGLFSTSANIAGHEIPQSLNELDPDIIKQIQYIVLEKNSINHRYPIIPSTILDGTGSKIKVIREGAYPIKELEAIYGQPFDWFKNGFK